MDADLPDVKSAILAFQVCVFYRHFGKYFLFVSIWLFAILMQFQMYVIFKKVKKEFYFG